MPAAITFAGDDPNVPQIITISGALTTNGTTPLVFPPIPYIGVNQGKPEYYYEAEGVEVTAVWTGTRWELQDFISGVGWFNNTAFASPDLVTPWLALGSNTGTPVVTAGPSLQGTAIGQLCKTPDAWWRWDGSAWEEDAAGGVTDHGALDGLGDDDHPQYAKLAGANTFTSTSNSFTQPLYLNSAILGVVTSPIAGAYNGNGAGLTGDAQNLIVGYATLAGVAYSFAGTLPIASGGTGGATQPAAWTGLGGGGTIASPTFTGLTTSASTYANNATFTYNNAAAITNHRNALGLGTLQAVTFSGLTSNGFVDVAITSATSTRESVFRAKISDAGNDTFQISNGTITDGRFIPAFSGFVQSTNLRESLIFYGLVTAANDVTSSSAAGAINLLGARTNSTSDPINGTLTSLVNRRVLTIAHNAASAVDLDFSMICEAGGAVKFPSLQPVTILGRTNTTGGLVLGSFTVAAFPSTTYLMAVVTDALAPVVGAAVAAGGSAKCIVCYNGTSKIVTALL
jgi:hypothetical protein